MKQEFVQPFLNSAKKVISTEASLEINPGKIQLQLPTYTSRGITFMVGVIGKVQGTIIYGMDKKTATNLVSEILGVPNNEFNRLAISAISEICNVITSLATVEIEKMGYASKITPPTLIAGEGVRISTYNLQRLLIPLQTRIGDIDISSVLVDEHLVPQKIAI